MYTSYRYKTLWKTLKFRSSSIEGMGVYFTVFQIPKNAQFSQLHNIIDINSNSRQFYLQMRDVCFLVYLVV